MSHAEIDTILDQALQMPEEERAEIAQKLLASLEESPDIDVEEAWQEEVARRIRDLESGVVCIPWEEVRRRLQSKGL